ncbi:MAG: flagellar biosynthesis anti-sigma factor FlgM [Pseudomonadota bacterium]
MTSINNLTGRGRAYDIGSEDRSRAGLASNTRPGNTTSGTAESGNDSITLTETGSKLSATAREMASTPAFDSAKVERIKTLIAEGRYSIDPQRIADRFMELESALGSA